jgi:hypothetical protein
MVTVTYPPIKAGLLTIEPRPFCCSAVLLEVSYIRKKIAKGIVAE